MAWDYQLLCARPLLALRLGRLIKSSASQSNWVAHRSTGLCSSALRPCAQTLAPTWEELSPIDLHMLNTQPGGSPGFKRRRFPLLCGRDVTVDVETSADVTSGGPRVCLHIHAWAVRRTRRAHAHKRFPQTRFKQPLRAIFNTLARVCEG